MLYQCPLCTMPLALERDSLGCKRLSCQNNHQFDIAKEGYVNLIPANKKRSKNPGDNAEMTQARRRFLNNHHYAPLRERLADLIATSQTNNSIRILDIGCGEGYYTAHIQQCLANIDRDTTVYGLDVSKVAVRYASKHYPECHFSVASSQALPFQSESLDFILRIYAPCNGDELLRCLSDNGRLITVTPAANHLYQLRERIYDSVRPHDEGAEQLTGFQLTHQEKLCYDMALSGSDTLDLLQMIPFAWKATTATKESLASADIFPCTAEFLIRIYDKG